MKVRASTFLLLAILFTGMGLAHGLAWAFDVVAFRSVPTFTDGAGNVQLDGWGFERYKVQAVEAHILAAADALVATAGMLALWLRRYGREVGVTEAGVVAKERVY